MGKEFQELQKLLSEQKALRKKLEISEGATDKLRISLARAAAVQLFEVLGVFLEQFSTGSLSESFEAVSEHLAGLAEHDPGYLTEFATARPYDMDLSLEQRYVLQYLFGSPWVAGARLLDVLSRMTANANVKGNPLNFRKEQ